MKIFRLYLYSFFDTFFIYMPYLALFLALNKGLNNNQIAIVLSGFSFSVFIFEIPTGFIADKIGAKQSIVIGFIIRLLGIATLTFANSFIIIILGEVLIGLGATFCSGADQSLLYKVVHSQEFEKERYGKIISNYFTISWFGLTISFLCGQFLANISYFSIFYISIAITLLGLFIALSLPKISVEDKHDSIQIIKNAVIDIVKNNKLTSIFLLASFIFSILASSYLLFQPYLNEINLAGKNNGLIFFFVTLFAIIGSKLQPIIAKKTGPIINIVMLLALSITIIVIGFTKGLTVIGFFCIFRLIWGISSPLISKEMNEVIIHDESRSTILSIQSLASNLLQGIILFLAGIFTGSISVKLIVIGFSVLFLCLLLEIRRRKLTTAST